METARINKEQIKAIWALSHVVGMEHDEVYAMARVEHLHDLTMSGAIQMINLLKHMAGQDDDKPVPQGKPTSKEMGMINALRMKLGWSDERLQAFIEKRFRISHPRFLDDKTARKVIEALKAMLAGGRGERRLPND
jgi:hypothetical protein